MIMMIKRIFMCFVVDVIIVVSISGGAFVFLQNIRSKNTGPHFKPQFEIRAATIIDYQTNKQYHKTSIYCIPLILSRCDSVKMSRNTSSVYRIRRLKRCLSAA